MKLVIIAGGKGQRLGLSDMPKPMVPVCGIPLLERQVLLARSGGVTEIVFLLGYKAEMIIEHFGDGSRYGLRIRHIVEDAPLGSGGCLKLLESYIQERFLVFNGDLLIDFDIRAFQRFDLAHPESATSIIVHPNDHPHDSDVLEQDENNRVERFHFKPHSPGAFLPNLVNAGVYIFSPKVFELIRSGESMILEKGLYPRILEKGLCIYGYRTSEYIKDVGTPQRILEVEADLATGRVAARNATRPQRAVFLDRDGVVVRYKEHLTSVEQLELLPGAAGAIKSINRSGRLAILVTNQPMLAKGFMTRADLRQIHFKLETLLGHEGAYLDDIFFCPHHPERGFPGEVQELKVSCDCRKPSPGMIMRAAAKYNIELGASWMVGDEERDLEAGRRAGCRCCHIRREKGSFISADAEVRSLEDAVVRILAED
ncbi:MAG: HAD-IIIA family hydrolase [Planctomycetes bacterium]|nr:HAD-IIIA family hydrolase [Planctomycetota bacterium]